jgi:hypothetical protein
VSGLGSRVQGFWGLRLRAQVSGLGARGSGFRAWGVEFRVQGLGYMVGFRVQDSKFRVL